MFSKKGETSIGVTVAIILAIVLIIFLIWGFSTQWSIFTSTGTGIAGKSNIDALRQACALHCDNGRQVEFCEVERTIIDANGESSQGTCESDVLGAAACSAFSCSA